MNTLTQIISQFEWLKMQKIERIDYKIFAISQINQRYFSQYLEIIGCVLGKADPIYPGKPSQQCQANKGNRLLSQENR